MLGREFVYLDLKRAGLIGHESDGDRYPGSKVLDETEETDGIAGPRCAGGRRSEEEMRSEAEKETLRAQAKRDLSQLVAANLAAWCARLDIQMPVWDRDKAYAVVRDTGDSELNLEFRIEGVPFTATQRSDGGFEVHYRGGWGEHLVR